MAAATVNAYVSVSWRVTRLSATTRVGVTSVATSAADRARVATILAVWRSDDGPAVARAQAADTLPAAVSATRMDAMIRAAGLIR